MGGKAHHIKHLDPVFPVFYDTFVDVFGGAGWVSVKSQNIRRAKTRVYNDYNPHLANIFTAFKTDPTGLIAMLESWPFRDPDLYRKFQIEIFGDNIPATGLETAAKYLYLEVQSFSGNTLGLNSSIYFDPKNIKGLHSLIRKLKTDSVLRSLRGITVVENMDCIDVIQKYDSPDTFFYLDPPYYRKEHYYTKDFGNEKHYELSKILNNISGKFVLSYYEFPELHEWYPEPKYQHLQYSISKQSSSNNNKTRGIEYVIRNY